ncbi:MAG: hypothetical protein QMD09_15100, partial [Desulfatibacillaceae bacterium]|nr:hypothetical protein [Desulfatibacillaceae bacterium]
MTKWTASLPMKSANRPESPRNSSQAGWLQKVENGSLLDYKNPETGFCLPTALICRIFLSRPTG